MMKENMRFLPEKTQRLESLPWQVCALIIQSKIFRGATIVIIKTLFPIAFQILILLLTVKPLLILISRLFVLSLLI